MTKLLSRRLRNLSDWWIILPLICLALLVRLYHIDYPLLDTHAFRQTQTASVVRNYYRRGINPLTARLDVFGTGKEQTLVLEFPFYQVIVAALYKIFGPAEIWGRFVSILFGFAGAFYLYKLTEILLDRHTALWAALFFLASPLNIFYQRTFLMESAVVCCGIMMLYYFVHWEEKGGRSNRWKAGCAASLGLVMKSPYNGVLLLPVVYCRLKKRGVKGLLKLDFLLALAVPLAILFAWQQYMTSVNIQSGHANFTLSDPAMKHWLFGKLGYRISYYYWLKIFETFNREVLGQGMVFFFLLALWLKFPPESAPFLNCWLLTEFIYVLIMFRMVATHNYYNMPLVPVAAVCCAYSLNWILGREKARRLLTGFLGRVIALITAGIFLLSGFLQAKPLFALSMTPLENGAVIRRYVPAEAPLVYAVPKYDWDPQYLYHADRRGIYLGYEQLALSRLEELREEGYQYLAIAPFCYMDEIPRKIFPPPLPYKLLYKDKKLLIYRLDEQGSAD